MPHILEESSLTIKVKNEIAKVYANDFTCDQRVALMKALKECVCFSLGEKYLSIEASMPIESRVHGKRELVGILSNAFITANMNSVLLTSDTESLKLNDFLCKVQVAASR